MSWAQLKRIFKKGSPVIAFAVAHNIVGHLNE